jgi:hypothetical protein
MEQPEPAPEMPDRPLSEEAAREYADDPETVAVWVMDDDAVAAVPDTDDDAVRDLVVETETGYEMYSYAGGEWKDYGTQRKDDDEAPSMAGTLDSYRVLAGDPEEF